MLNDKRGILEELIRKRVLEDADGAVDIYELRERLLQRNLEDEDLLEPIIDSLPRDDRLYLLESIENNTFKDAAGEAIYRPSRKFDPKPTNGSGLLADALTSVIH